MPDGVQHLPVVPEYWSYESNELATTQRIVQTLKEIYLFILNKMNSNTKKIGI